jgi:hypothetical protein
MNTTREHWMQLKLQGWSYGRIAKQAGVSRQRVQQVLSPPKAIRAIIAKRAKYACEMCGAPLQQGGHVHHQSGDDAEHYEDIEHLQYLCQTCHWSVHGNHQKKGPTDVLYLRVAPSVKTTLTTQAKARHTTVQALADQAFSLLFQELNCTP